jgi:hypothetical protein
MVTVSGVSFQHLSVAPAEISSLLDSAKKKKSLRKNRYTMNASPNPDRPSSFGRKALFRRVRRFRKHRRITRLLEI